MEIITINEWQFCGIVFISMIIGIFMSYVARRASKHLEETEASYHQVLKEQETEEIYQQALKELGTILQQKPMEDDCL